MIAFKYRQEPETAAIVVIPAEHKHTPQIAQIAGAAYGVAPEQVDKWFSADQYAARINTFSEGQFVAIDTASDRVVGFTSSMRFEFDPSKPLIESWERTTGYG